MLVQVMRQSIAAILFSDLLREIYLVICVFKVIFPVILLMIDILLTS